MRQREIKQLDEFYSVKQVEKKEVAKGEKAVKVIPTVSKIEPYYGIDEASKLLNIPRRWIDNAINSGELIYYQMGARQRKVKLSKVNEMIERKQYGGENTYKEC